MTLFVQNIIYVVMKQAETYLLIVEAYDFRR